MDNRAYDRWQEVIAAEDPDVVLAVEVDDNWGDAAPTSASGIHSDEVYSQSSSTASLAASRNGSRIRSLPASRSRRASSSLCAVVAVRAV